MSTNALLEQLLDERAIEQQLIRFARGMDDRDWDALRAILAEDAEGDLGEGPLKGAEAIIGTIRKYLDSCGTTQHLLGNMLVTVSGATASSRTYVFDQHLPATGPVGQPYHSLGDYRDRWEKRGGSWKLVARVKDNRASVGSLDVFALKK